MSEDGQKKLLESSVSIEVDDIHTELPHVFGKRVIEPLYCE